jgi:hypothetical protein
MRLISDIAESNKKPFPHHSRKQACMALAEPKVFGSAIYWMPVCRA